MGGRSAFGAPNTGRPVVAAWLCACLLVWVIIVPGPASATARGEPKRVLLLHSFGREFRPWSEYARTIRAELERRSPWPLDLQDQSLLTARSDNPGAEAPFVDYLRSLYQGGGP